MAVRLILSTLALALIAGCATLPPAGKAALTPFAVIRDAVDTPLFTIANIFESGANAIDRAPDNRLQRAWSGPIDYVIYWTLEIPALLCELVGTVFGVPDYILCRSIYPNFPRGAKVWVRGKEPWGPLYFPNTRALWAEPPPPSPTPTPPS